MGCGNSKAAGADNATKSPTKSSGNSGATNPKKGFVEEKASNELKEKAKELIANDDVKGFRELLKEISPLQNLDEEEGEDITCLHVAAENNAYKVMQLMIDWLKLMRREDDLKTFFNYNNIMSQTPVTYCIIRNNPECCYVLAKNGVIDWNYKTVRGWTLMETAEACNSTSLDVLLEFKDGVEKDETRQERVKAIAARIEASKN